MEGRGIDGRKKNLKMLGRIEKRLHFFSFHQSIVNPNSGWGKGVQNYEKFVEPIFQVAAIESKAVTTKNANHIHEIVENENLEGR